MEFLKVYSLSSSYIFNLFGFAYLCGMQLSGLDTLIPTQKIDLSAFGIEHSSLYIKRDDLIHPFVSGNKFRKLKYNVEVAKTEGCNTLVTFGGAFSNHIAAVAFAGRENGFKTVGIIRGEELVNKVNGNSTLQFARNCGMELHFITREKYSNKNNPEYLEMLDNTFPNCYILPEGGTNALAIKGCTEILEEEDKRFEYICVPVGTGGTLAGIVKASHGNQKVLGFSALKGTFHRKEVAAHTARTNYSIMDTYCFGGYAKIEIELVRFINEFHRKTGIPLDPVYTGKMMFGIFDLIKRGAIEENSRILAIHTGGLQGVAGMNDLLQRKNLPLID